MGRASPSGSIRADAKLASANPTGPVQEGILAKPIHVGFAVRRRSVKANRVRLILQDGNNTSTTPHKLMARKSSPPQGDPPVQRDHSPWHETADIYPRNNAKHSSRRSTGKGLGQVSCIIRVAARFASQNAREAEHTGRRDPKGGPTKAVCAPAGGHLGCLQQRRDARRQDICRAHSV